MPIDPVCGMEVDTDTPYKMVFEGETYYFCSRTCLDEFLENADEYVTPTKETYQK